MSTLTITEFLEARIAEDEAVAGPAYSWESPDYRISEWEGNYNGGLDIPASRLRAECAAKRAIIEAFDPEAPDLDPYVGRSVIAMLAAVYADHPDYRQEWAL